MRIQTLDAVEQRTYAHPLQLWDSNSRNLTNFSTHFSFVIDSNGRNRSADGLAFFLAPIGSRIPFDSAGAGLGLSRRDGSISTMPSRSFVSVEFDTFPNDFDPRTPHVGININSLESIATAIWRSNVTLGRENDATVSYNGSSMTLRVDFTGFTSTGSMTQDLASALLYLHEEWDQCVVHRDIKTSNIMLDASFNAKLGDFGLARLVDHEKGSQTTLPAGTFAYMAPECFSKLRSSKESDVYSFGVVLLEIASGRKAYEFCDQENETNLVEWVWKLYGEGEILDAADPRLSTQFDKQEMEHLMVVGLWSTHPNSSQRPSIRRAIQVLNLDASLPILPSTMPLPAYHYTTNSNAHSSISTSGSVYTNTSNSADQSTWPLST